MFLFEAEGNMKKSITYPKLTLLLLFSAMAMFSGCNGGTTSSMDEGYQLDSLLASPKQVVIDKYVIVMEAYLWRDFMPTIAETADHRMRAHISLLVDSTLVFPAEVKAEKLWVIKGKDVWETTLTEAVRSSSRREYSAHEGPEWETGLKVDVVVRFSDRDKVYYVRTSDVVISRTE